MTQFKKDMLSALVFLVIGIAVLVAIPYTISSTTISGVGPRTFPTFVGTCIIGISSLLALSTLFKYRKDLKAAFAARGAEKTAEQKKTALANEIRALLGAVIIFLYALAFDKVSYFISTFVMITALLLVFRIKKPLPYIICYIAAVIVWACFTYFFSVRLP